MLNCFSLPSCRPINGVYYRVVANNNQTQKTTGGLNLNNLVIYDKNGIIEGGFVGVVKKIQISTSIITFIPNENDKIKIKNSTYKLRNIIFKDQNPYFIPFYEADLKFVD